MRVWRRAVLLALLLAAPSAHATTPAPCGLVRLADVPITLDRNRPVAEVEINGRLARLIIDTGSTRTVLTQAAITRLALPLDKRASFNIRGVGGSSRNFAVTVADLRLGGQSLPRQRAGMLPAATSLGSRIDGLLSLQQIRGYDIDLDLPGHRIGLYRGRTCAGAALPFAGPITSVPASITTPKPRLMLPVRLDGHALQAMLDTGAHRSVVLSRTAVSDQAVRHDRSISMSGVGSARSTLHLHRFGRLVVGGDILAHPLFAAGRLPNHDMDTILGADYLAHRRLFLAFSSNTIFIQSGFIQSGRQP